MLIDNGTSESSRGSSAVSGSGVTAGKKIGKDSLKRRRKVGFHLILIIGHLIISVSLSLSYLFSGVSSSPVFAVCTFSFLFKSPLCRRSSFSVFGLCFSSELCLTKTEATA